MKKLSCERTGQSGWTALLGEFEDANIYQTPSCGEVLWKGADLTHIVLKAGNDITGIAQVATIKAPLMRGGTALVFWGPLWQKRGQNTDMHCFHGIIDALRAEFVSKKNMLLRIIPNKIGSGIDDMRAIFEKAGFLWKGRFYKTYLLDLSRSPDHIRKQLKQKWRNHLNRAEKGELTVTSGTSIDAYDAFYDIFLEMQRRKQFSDVPLDPFKMRIIQQNLQDNLKARIFICKKENEALAGAVVTAIGDTAILILAATNNEGRKLMASYFLQWKIIEWLQAKKIRYYDLGGISSAHPHVNYFKAGLGGNEVDHAGLFELCPNPAVAIFDRALGVLKALGIYSR